MICLDNTDTLEGGASVANVVDYTVHGLVGTTFTNIAQGQLSDSNPSVLYTAGAAISIVSITLVNTHSAAVTVDLYLDPADAGTPRRLIPKTMTLGIGYSATFDGQRLTVQDASGSIITSNAALQTMQTIYPVGALYISTLSTNPATLLGFGTWAAFGAGRALVGLDAGQAEFDTVEETGGEKTHTLTEAEMPAHTHSYWAPTGGGSVGGGGSITNVPSLSTGSTGDSGAHNNLQPYIVVYMWKRTA